MEQKKKTGAAPKSGGAASKKYSYSKNSPGSKSNTPAKAPADTRRSAPPKNQAAPAIEYRRTFMQQIMPFVFTVAAVFLSICIFAKDAGAVGNFVRSYILFALFGKAVYLLPLFLLIIALFWYSDTEKGMVRSKLFSSLLTLITVAAILHIFTSADSSLENLNPIFQYKEGVAQNGGGMIGGFIGALFIVCFKKAASLILLFAVFAVLLLMMFGVTPRSLYLTIAYKIKMRRDSREIRRAQRAEEDERRIAALDEKYHYNAPSRDIPPASADSVDAKGRRTRKLKFNTDVPVGGKARQLTISDIEDEYSEDETRTDPAAPVIDESVFSDAMKSDSPDEIVSGEVSDDVIAAETELYSAELRAKNERIKAESAVPYDEADTVDEDNPDLNRIFVSPEDEDLLNRLAEQYLNGTMTSASSSTLNVNRTQVGTVQSAPEKPAPPEYEFPPLTLLSEGTGAKKQQNIREELFDNATRLVETLQSFNVKTRIVGVSRGPTITRYELLPEAGTRVRSISNLIDDISLSLATSGVRIEAPIPGKAAVGIEVPNKVLETVNLRTMLEDAKFTEAKSKITVALGMDVAGGTVFFDIAKMPHLLIAGATGMGKSVCINSLIISMLYKASPDEVKLILIDPKKVELNVYNGLPHLLVPVVSDPKKAAGSLAWAVSEMERRFALIEVVGARNIADFNRVTEKDPEYEFMPQIVIIIDELADLMMTAPDDVEDSICRLAQKARAAGMHLIIGTQRPSVDVITGLIKSNIPSRIAFTVASQVDSRTIIDRAGAENLIGRGDMLYNPVGAAKPIRVQGAFVDTDEVEKIVTFISSHNGSQEYSDDVMKEIDRQAAACNSGKKGSSAYDLGDDEDDPMLRKAIELAVDSGKISTSLIQRRLSLGYGRAAKLIDMMEQKGYVSAPDGQKPREVLITKQQYMEMVVRDTD